jgi:hypothetical protein
MPEQLPVILTWDADVLDRETRTTLGRYYWSRFPFADWGINTNGVGVYVTTCHHSTVFHDPIRRSAARALYDHYTKEHHA